MQVVHERCGGLDVHKRTVVACVLISRPDGSVQREVRTFGTLTVELLALSDWLSGLGVRQLAMESTGVFWRPVFNLLEEGRSILLVNPEHLKRVPGHKTDVHDAPVAHRTCCAMACCEPASSRHSRCATCAHSCAT